MHELVKLVTKLATISHDGMAKKPAASYGPVVVHCEDGISKSGTLAALYFLLESLRHLNAPNVKEVVTSIRQQRAEAVPQIEQYYFLYRALLELVTVDNWFADGFESSLALIYMLRDRTTNSVCNIVELAKIGEPSKYDFAGDMLLHTDLQKLKLDISNTL
ncbi:unnamed protein product [Soboliphyme baturini]|uniref:TYR_PHOSPHATASE_2 domain-containing protein n=1 Tax=Soboliphyme baturini TaxID=241478 RepID=A0A183IFP4_9BILA|nr:unnamed protein product [Soboliphyme baturini]